MRGTQSCLATHLATLATHLATQGGVWVAMKGEV